jgi:hypothetical protein
VETLKRWLSSVFAVLTGLVVFLVVIYVAIVIFAAIDWGFIRNEVTKYPLLCEHAIEHGTCKRVAFPLNPTTFKVMTDRQEVVYWTHLGPDFIRPERLTKCAVRDRYNWSCRYNDESAELGFSSGAYRQTILKPAYMVGIDTKEMYVGRWSYYNQQCGGYVRALLLCRPLEAVFDVLISWLS